MNSHINTRSSEISLELFAELKVKFLLNTEFEDLSKYLLNYTDYLNGS